MRKILTLVIISSFVFTSCTPMHEVDDYAYIIALGIDKADDGNLLLTYSFANSLSIGSGGAEGESGGKPGNSLLNISMTAKDIFDGIDVLNKNISKTVEMSHLKLIVFSKEIANLGLEKYINDFMLDMSIRPKTIIAVSDVPPSDYLENLKMSFEVNPEKYINDIFKDNSSSFVTACTMNEFYNNLTLANVVPLVTVSDQDEKSVISGLCIFKKDKLKKVYVENDVICHNLLSGKVQNTNYTVSSGNDAISYEITQETSPRIKVDTSEKYPKINISIPLNCRIKARSVKMKNSDTLLEKELTTIIRQYLYKSAKTLNVDIERFSKYAKMNFLTIEDFENYNWDEKYKKAEFNVMIDAKIQTE